MFYILLMYWRLRKGLYGLRQAGRQWYLTLHDAYTALGYTRCQSDWSMYTRRSESSFSMSATSVDDILLASDSKDESNRATSEINDKFTITDSGDTEWIVVFLAWPQAVSQAKPATNRPGWARPKCWPRMAFGSAGGLKSSGPSR